MNMYFPYNVITGLNYFSDAEEAPKIVNRKQRRRVKKKRVIEYGEEIRENGFHRR